jgi:predicted O-methyltransferase YrrM
MKSDSKITAGPFFASAYSVLKDAPEFQSFRSGTLSREKYAALLDRLAPELIAAGLPAEDVEYAKRYPVSDEAFVRDALNDMVARGILDTSAYDEEFYQTLEAELRDFDHQHLRTYIYPEESRLLFAVADIIKPKNAVFLGSYYGYWAYPAAAAIVRGGGKVVLVDPDEKTQEIARQNFAGAAHAAGMDYAVTTGEEFLARNEELFDFVVIDAEGPRTHPDPEQRGKRVYRSLLENSLPHLAPSSVLVCHNILFTHFEESDFFARTIKRNTDELDSFLELARREFPDFTEYTSTEGVGVGSRRA